MGNFFRFGITFLLQVNQKMGSGGKPAVIFDTKYRNKVDLVSLSTLVLSFLFRIKSKK